MKALLQFAGLICMFTFLVVGMDYMKSFDDRFIEMFGMVVVALGVFISSVLFYLGWLVKMKEEEKEICEYTDSESILYRNINKIVNREIKEFKVKRLKLSRDRA